MKESVPNLNLDITSFFVMDILFIAFNVSRQSFGDIIKVQQNEDRVVVKPRG